jgi:hypothetical protein
MAPRFASNAAPVCKHNRQPFQELLRLARLLLRQAYLLRLLLRRRLRQARVR